MATELLAALIGALITVAIPIFIERFRKGDQKYKFVYVKIIHLRRREHGRSPVYRATLRRLARKVDVFDEYHFFRLNIFYRHQKEFRFSDRTSGAVDLQILHPWQESLTFPDKGAEELLNFVEQTIATKSDIFLTKSIYYNALQDSHEDIGMKLERDTDEARIIIDFSSLPQHERVLLSAPVAHLRDIEGKETSAGVINPYPGVYAIEVKNGKKGLVIRVNFAINWDLKYIFGYGSLLNKESASRALEEPSESIELLPAVLKGYRRSWTLKETVFSRELGKEVEAAFLDIREAAGSSVNGVLIAVDQDKLRHLSLREKNYDLIDITDHIQVPGQSEFDKTSRVFTFRGTPSHRIDNRTDSVYLLASYREKVLAGCQSLGADFVRSFQESTDEPEFPLLNGAYTFIDRAQARYV
jgi:cation transport regulator ChaC